MSTADTQTEDYERRRKHIEHLCFEKVDKPFTWIVRETGRPKQTQYFYCLQVVHGYPGKQSKYVLDDMETVLKHYGYWEPIDDEGE